MITSQRVRVPTGELAVRVRAAAFELTQLCGFAARDNPKRGFLFVSKVLGKHWPAAPGQMRRIHDHLAAQLDLGPGPWLFIAMAETATGLGQGVFESALAQWPGSAALFVHSTRYQVPGLSYLEFLEPHCHAPDQYLYAPIDPDQLALFRAARQLVLIDDEISTGTTLCNLVDAYRALNPAIAGVHFVAITNFSGADSAARFSARLGLPVRCVSALDGDFSFTPGDWSFSTATPPAVGDKRRAPGQIALDLGRCGIDRALELRHADLDRLTAGLPAGAAILVLGTGEFMHLAFRVGLALESRGFTVAVQSTTRSPILIGADIQRRLVFADNYGEGIRNYLYNVDPTDYARILVCHETPLEGLDELVQQLGPACLTYRYPPAV